MQDHDRSVAVGVVPMPARGADEGRLVLAASSVHGPAGRAGLRTVGRIDLNQPRRFVGQHHFDLMPSDVQDRAVQPAFCPDISPRLGKRALCGARHGTGAQLFDNDSPEAAGNIRGGFMRAMLAGAGLLGLHCSTAADSLAPAVRPALAPGRGPLRLAVLALKDGDVGGKAVTGAIRQHQRNGDTTINADRQAVINGFLIEHAPNADLPAQCRTDNGGFADGALHGARPAEPQPADLGHLHAPPPLVEAFNGDFTPREAEGIASALALELREPSLPLEEPLKRSVEVLQDASLSGLADGGNPIKFGTQPLQLAALRHIVEVVARGALILPPVVAALLKRNIPDDTTYASKLIHLGQLFLRWTQRVCIPSVCHAT